MLIIHEKEGGAEIKFYLSDLGSENPVFVSCSTVLATPVTLIFSQ